MKCDQVIERIKARIAAVDPNGPRKVLGVFQLNIDSSDGMHKWICDLKALTVTEGTAASPDVTLDVDDDTFTSIGAKTLTLSDAVAQGKVKVSGDQGLVSALAEVLK